MGPEAICSEAVDKKTGMVSRDKLRKILAYERQVGIGMEKVLDEMFDKIDHQRNGQLYLLHIAQMFFPNQKYKKANCGSTPATPAPPKVPRPSSNQRRSIPLQQRAGGTPLPRTSRGSTGKIRPPQTARHD